MGKITKMLSISLLLFIIAIFVVRKITKSEINPPLPTFTLKLNDSNSQIEIAKTNEQKSAGLSGRKSLCPNCGMIFVFDQESIYPFWMKDTLIPLDMLWLDRKGKIVSIFTAEPEPNIPLYKLKLYQNTLPALYVLELNASDSAKLKLAVGDNINLDSL